MSIYHATPQVEVEIERVRLTAPQRGEMTVWYHVVEGGIEEEHGVTQRAHISEFLADDGLDELREAIAELDDDAIDGDHPWAVDARNDDVQN